MLTQQEGRSGDESRKDSVCDQTKAQCATYVPSPSKEGIDARCTLLATIFANFLKRELCRSRFWVQNRDPGQSVPMGSIT